MSKHPANELRVLPLHALQIRVDIRLVGILSLDHDRVPTSNPPWHIEAIVSITMRFSEKLPNGLTGRTVPSTTTSTRTIPRLANAQLMRGLEISLEAKTAWDVLEGKASASRPPQLPSKREGVRLLLKSDACQSELGSAAFVALYGSWWLCGRSYHDAGTCR